MGKTNQLSFVIIKRSLSDSFELAFLKMKILDTMWDKFKELDKAKIANLMSSFMNTNAIYEV